MDKIDRIKQERKKIKDLIKFLNLIYHDIKYGDNASQWKALISSMCIHRYFHNNFMNEVKEINDDLNANKDKH